MLSRHHSLPTRTQVALDPTQHALSHTRRWTDAKAANGYSMDGSVETKFKPTTEKWAGDKAGAGPEEEDTVASEDLK